MTDGDRHHSARTTLRVVGAVLVLVGVPLAMAGFASFFAAFGGDSAPSHFWLAFIGLPMTAIGVRCLLVGYLGSISRFAADETGPLWSRLGSLSRPVPPPPPAAGTPYAGAGGGTAHAFCTGCGQPIAMDDRFCGSCGHSLA